MTNELKPCPSCGNHEPLIQYENAGGLWHCKMICTYDAPAVVFECNGVGETREHAYEQAAEFWNTRYKRTCEWNIKHSGTLYDVYQCSACGYEYAESCTDHGIKVELCDAKFCPECGAEVVDGD